MARIAPMTNGFRLRPLPAAASPCPRVTMTFHLIANHRSIRVLALSVSTFVLAGCSGSDLSGYRPLEKTARSKATSTQSRDAAPTTVIADETPAAEPVATQTPLTTDSAAATLSVEEQFPVSALVPVNVVDGASVASLLKITPTEIAAPRKIEVLIPEKTFRTDAASKALRVSYDDLDLLKVLNMEPVTIDAIDHMPAWLKGLNGQRIKIRGYMFTTYETEGIERFVLARDNQICCFGRDPKVYDLVQVDLKSGKTTNYIPYTRAFDVVGRLKVEMLSADDKPFGLYFLEDAEIIDR